MTGSFDRNQIPPSSCNGLVVPSARWSSTGTPGAGAGYQAPMLKCGTDRKAPGAAVSVPTLVRKVRE